MQISYDSVPDDHITKISEIVDRFKHMCPPWLETLYVGFSTAEDEGTCTIHVQYDYRWARLTIHPRWFVYNDTEKSQHVIHEFMHIFFWPYSDFMEVALGKLLEDGPAKQIIMDEARARMEMAVQDLMFYIRRNHERT